MTFREARTKLPPSIGIGIAFILVLSLAYALLVAQILLWVFSVAFIGFSATIIYLFYRLVVAIEEIARKL